MATYLIDEEVLRQVLDALEDKSRWSKECSLAMEALRTILASPPAEPMAWAHKTNTSAVLRSVGGTMETNMWVPLFRKDT